MVAATAPHTQSQSARAGADTFLTMTEVCRELRVSESTIRRWQKEGRFPRPVKIGPRTVRFSANEIRQWLDDRYAEAAVPQADAEKNEPAEHETLAQATNEI